MRAASILTWFQADTDVTDSTIGVRVCLSERIASEPSLKGRVEPRFREPPGPDCELEREAIDAVRGKREHEAQQPALLV